MMMCPVLPRVVDAHLTQPGVWRVGDTPDISSIHSQYHRGCQVAQCGSQSKVFMVVIFSFQATWTSFDTERNVDI